MSLSSQFFVWSPVFHWIGDFVFSSFFILSNVSCVIHGSFCFFSVSVQWFQPNILYVTSLIFCSFTFCGQSTESISVTMLLSLCCFLNSTSVLSLVWVSATKSLLRKDIINLILFDSRIVPGVLFYVSLLNIGYYQIMLCSR